MKLNDLSNYLNELLTPEKFNDYCPNGLLRLSPAGFANESGCAGSSLFLSF